jgi:diguanylate cyclase (GGDEF)-like protein/PAS domain S-box-containing protein
MDDFAASHAPCGLAELDVDGRIVDVNRAFSEWTGSDPSALVGRPLTDFIGESEATARAVSDQRTGPSGVRALTVKLLHADGSTRPVLISWRREGDRIIVALFDATKREEFENRITREHSLAARQERRLNLLLRSAVGFADAMDEAALAEELASVARDAYAATSAAVLLVDDTGRVTIAAGSTPLEADVGGHLLSDRALALRTIESFPDISADSHLPAAFVDRLSAAGVVGLLVAPILHESHQRGLLAVYFDHIRTFDAEAAPLADALTRQAGQVIARIELTKQLQRSAMLDEITGLPNRRLFEEQVHRSALSDELVGVAFIDLDGFKTVNDTLGHEAGDVVLREVARRIQSVVRERDSVARFGGDEFVAVWTVHEREAAEMVAERIRAAVAQPYGLPGSLSISASIGLAVSRLHPEQQVADRLVRVADQAMYRAKSEGGNRVVVAVE